MIHIPRKHIPVVMTFVGILGLLAIVFIILLGYSPEVKADSLICDYKGLQLIYTEVQETDDPAGVGSVYINQVNARVIFHNDKEYRFGSIIPCVMIKENRGETKFLEEYLSQFESSIGE